MSRSDARAGVVALQFRDVSAARAGKLVWAGATFDVPADAVVAVIGPNGSGKTTLVEMILGLIPAASGSIRVFGRRPAAGSALGYVPQDYGSIGAEEIRAVDRVLLGLTGHRWLPGRVTAGQRRQALESLAAVGAQSFARTRTSLLSGGQRQRVAIAEALVASPRMLILDEPLAALDLHSQRRTVDLLAQLRAGSGLTIVVAAHDLNPLLPILDGAVYIHRGAVRYASIDNVLDDVLLSELYATPVAVVDTPHGRRVVTST